MLMPDVNMLVYAHRADALQHDAALEWMDELPRAMEPFALSSLTAAGFVRVVTGRGLAAGDPSSLTSALDFVDEILAASNCRWVTPGPEHWKIFSRLCSSSRSTGKLVGDAQHAAVAIEHGCTLVSADGDFKRFAEHGLRWTHLKL